MTQDLFCLYRGKYVSQFLFHTTCRHTYIATCIYATYDVRGNDPIITMQNQEISHALLQCALRIKATQTIKKEENLPLKSNTTKSFLLRHAANRRLCRALSL